MNKSMPYKLIPFTLIVFYTAIASGQDSPQTNDNKVTIKINAIQHAAADNHALSNAEGDVAVTDLMQIRKLVESGEYEKAIAQWKQCDEQRLKKYVPGGYSRQQFQGTQHPLLDAYEGERNKLNEAFSTYGEVLHSCGIALTFHKSILSQIATDEEHLKSYPNDAFAREEVQRLKGKIAEVGIKNTNKIAEATKELPAQTKALIISYLSAKEEGREINKKLVAESEKNAKIQLQVEADRALAEKQRAEEAKRVAENDPFNKLLAKYSVAPNSTIPYVISGPLDKDKYYYINKSTASQVTDDFILVAGYDKRPAAILVFENPSALETVSIQQGGIVEAIGRFVAFKTVQMVSGADERYPVFSCVGIKVMARDFINTEKK